MRFRHERIDANPPAGRMSFCLTTDLTGNGLPDVLVGALGGRYPVTLPILDKPISLRALPGTRELIHQLETNVFWYENPGWERHEVGHAPNLSVGGTFADLTGDGSQDLLTGQNLDTDLYWFEQPDDPRERWTRRLITNDFEKFHDIVVGDVDNDSEDEVVVLSQRSEVIFYYDIPEDPSWEPWPETNRHVIAEDIYVEGAAIADVDGDGENELVAGPNIFRQCDGRWEREEFAPGWQWTRVAVADVDDDGAPEILLTEGDRPYNGDQPGRLGVFDPADDSLTVLRDGLSNPHTLQVADFDGDGRLDICVAEMGLDGYKEPEVTVLSRRDDNFDFVETCLSRGIPTHEAKAVDLTGDGLPDLVGKSYSPTRHVDVWHNETR
ncbi:FG-GAP repeat domain-containing protein [Salinigranum halophilum]|uniref:FG-GAP repeat domain-containing protein n=1 Tax=Salinigranum halophilum TaxID=2565931 RepID=UPI0010A766F0|nr:VCBS repeat-containing protein [Salinigranum halophilum]